MTEPGDLETTLDRAVDVRPVAIRLRAPGLQQEDQERVGVFADLTARFPLVKHRFQRPLRRAPDRLLLERLRDGFLEVLELRLVVRVGLEPVVVGFSAHPGLLGCLGDHAELAERLEERGLFLPFFIVCKCVCRLSPTHGRPVALVSVLRGLLLRHRLSISVAR